MISTQLREMIESSYVISFLLVLLCCLAGLDLWRQLAIKSEDFWYSHYTQAVKSNNNYWKMGYRLEDLELKIDSQKNRWKSIRHVIDSLAPKFRIDAKSLRRHSLSITNTRQSRIAIHDLIRNDTAVYQIRCEKDGLLLRVGVDDFRTDSRDVCQIFTSANSDSEGPHTMFDVVQLVQEGNFALRSVGSGRFITAVPPPADNADAPWKLMVGGAAIGIAETFRQTEEGYLYSSAMGEP